MFPLSIIDNETGNTFEWNGSHTVNVYNRAGSEVDVFSFGFNEHGTPPAFVEFAQAVMDWTRP